MSATESFYKDIAEIRDLFHKYGKFDDPNAKLDELSKYLCIYVFEKQNPKLAKYKISDLLIEFENDNSFKIVPKIQSLFQNILQIKELREANGKSIFSNSQTLKIEINDDQFAYSLLKLTCNAVDSITVEKKNFDLLNECFGHFIRSNFRNHIEDAQYMTPNEVVELMCDIALSDINNFTKKSDKEFIVLDPCWVLGRSFQHFIKKMLMQKS